VNLPGAAPILVTGATGRVGREVVAALRGMGHPVRALTRNPASAGFTHDVEVVAGDFTVLDSIDAAAEGARAVFVVWTTAPATAADVVERLARHVERMVLLSSPHQTPHPFFQQPNPLASIHAGIERLVQGAGVQWTIIRPGMFAANAIAWWAPQIRAGDVVRWPYGAVETAPIDERDIAAVAARALIEDGHAGRDYVVTGPESLSQADQVRAIGDALGRRVRLHELGPEEFRRETAEHWPTPVVDMLLSAWGAAAGIPAYVTSTVADVTGTRARTFAEWAGAHADAFGDQSRGDDR
jgi:uncharacterized protein YbjT (DUF2867 family)